MLSVKKLSYYIAGKQLFEDVDFCISPKQHVGLFGRNGTGKSSLFKLILNQLSPDGGKIEISENWKILSVKQEMPSGDMTPLEFLLSQDEERHKLMSELETCEDTHRMTEIYDRLIQIDAYGAESRAAVVLRGLGFDSEDQAKPINTFSGGWRMRMALGAVLFQEPDLLLLDEPTNHLDLETANWLESFLKKYPKSFILISHDRDFLNSTVDGILHLKNKKITRYSGNLDTFLDTYNLKQKNAEAQNAKMEEKRQHMLEFIRRFQYKASKAKQAQSRIKALEKMKFLEIDQNDPTIAFNFPETEPLAPPVITFDRVSLGYGNKVVLKNISGSIEPDDRVAIVGKNGNGKTTFARFLAGELKPQKGIRQASDKLKIAFYKQDQFETLDLESSPYDQVRKYFPTLNDTQVRSHLGRVGFTRDQVFQKIKELSGGERARLIFAYLTANSPNLLILDEPTNHLDLEMRESLINTINTYRGAVIVISHDKSFLSRIANTVYLLKDQNVSPFDGDISSYE